MPLRGKELRNKVILSVDVPEIGEAQGIIQELGSMFGGILVPMWISPWRVYGDLFDQIRDSGAGLWLKTGSAFPSQIREEVKTALYHLFPLSKKDEEPIKIEGIIILCYPHVLRLVLREFREGIAKHKVLNDFHSIPEGWEPQLFPTAALTTEEMDDRVLDRALIAREYGSSGVIAPCKWVRRVRELGLQTIIAGIRDEHLSPVEDDDQVIHCTPEQAREADPDYYIIGRQATDGFIQSASRMRKAKSKAEHLISVLC